jgi:hypothetical protein
LSCDDECDDNDAGGLQQRGRGGRDGGAAAMLRVRGLGGARAGEATLLLRAGAAGQRRRGVVLAQRRPLARGFLGASQVSKSVTEGEGRCDCSEAVGYHGTGSQDLIGLALMDHIPCECAVCVYRIGDKEALKKVRLLLPWRRCECV